ncbi:MAG: tetratricopeptide repeat protein [Nitrospirae bacterium]|nr:tetratricopeptide repeat protein [Nitrospirota bacterium]
MNRFLPQPGYGEFSLDKQYNFLIIKLKKGGAIRNYTVVIMTAFFVLLSSFSYASETTYEQHIAKGVSDIEAKNYREAITEFESALKDSPGDFTTTLYLGIAQSRAGDNEAETTLKKALAMKPGDARASLELGIYYFNKAAYNTSADYFNRTIAAAPNTDLSAMAKEYLRVAALEGGAKPWMLNVSLGTQYDSNVVLNGAEGALPQGISRKSDWRAVLYLKGRYDFVKTDQAEASVAYSLYQSLHAKLTDFNVSSHLLDLRATHALSPQLSLRGIGAFEYSFIGGNNFASAYSLSPALIVSEGNGYSTVIEYKYKKSHFMNSDLFFNNAERTGSNNLVAITQNISLPPSVLARVSYSHDVDSTRQEFWSYRGDKVLAAIQFSLPRSIYLDLHGDYYHKNYKGAFQLPGDNRKDNVYTASVSATKLLSQRYSVTVGQLYTRNKSNTAVFDYKRAITSLFLNARF